MGMCPLELKRPGSLWCTINVFNGKKEGRWGGSQGRRKEESKGGRRMKKRKKREKERNIQIGWFKNTLFENIVQ